MSTDVDALVDPPGPAVGEHPRGTRRGGWWLVPEVLAVVALAATLIYQTATALSPAEVRAEVRVRAERAMETLPVADHHDHGHEVTEESRIVCGAELIGYEPADATSPDDVDTVYVSYLCASGPPGTTFEQAYKFSGPAVVSFGYPPAVKTVPLKAPYREGVVELMPDQYEARALAGFADPEIPRQVVLRYNALNSPPPGP